MEPESVFEVFLLITRPSGHEIYACVKLIRLGALAWNKPPPITETCCYCLTHLVNFSQHLCPRLSINNKKGRDVKYNIKTG